MDTKIKESILKEEIEYFNSMLAEWLQHYEGHYALVKDHKLYGTFTEEVEAYREGVKLFGNQSFLIKKIERIERLEKLPALTAGIIRAYS
jgi:hypothetical protein